MKNTIKKLENAGAKVIVNGQRIEATKLGSNRKVIVLVSENKAFAFASVDSSGYENFCSSLNKAIKLAWS